MRERALDRPVPGGGQVRAGQAQWADDPSGDLVAPGAAGDPFDDQAEQGVVGVGVGEARSRREHRRLCGREVEELADLPHLRGVTGDLLVESGSSQSGIPARWPSSMRTVMSAALANAAGDARGEHLGQPGVERQPAALGQLQHGDGDEHLHDAAGAEAIARVHRFGRRHAAEAGGAGPAAELGALHVQDRSRGVRARIAQRVAQRLLEPTGEVRVEARAGPGRDRRGVSRGARRPAQPGGGKGAGGAHQQRPAVDSAACVAGRNRREIIVPHAHLLFGWSRRCRFATSSRSGLPETPPHPNATTPLDCDEGGPARWDARRVIEERARGDPSSCCTLDWI